METRRALVITVALTVALVALFVTDPARSAQPSAGMISGQNRETAWKGGPFAGSNREGCLGPEDPTCDHYSLTVVAPQGALFSVAVVGPEAEQADLDLFVFYPDGSEAARSTGTLAGESVVVEHRSDRGIGPYEIRVQPNEVGPGAAYDGTARIQPSATSEPLITPEP